MRPIQLLGLVCTFLGSTGISLMANPTGGQVAGGSASIAGQGTGTVLINQTTDRAVINWQSFSINSGELTSFIQPSSSSAVLNRVSASGGLSLINGTLSANGQVFLINGNGIIVGPGGVVNANSFVASTRDIADTDFLSGNLHFTGSNTAGVQNLGTINALGGDVFLLGKTVDNQGTINAVNGTVSLASGDDILLNPAGQEHVFVSTSPTASAAKGQTAVHNSGAIAAATAELKAANGNLFALAINNEGTVRASTVTQSGGRVFLTADSGSIMNTGTVSAQSGSNGGSVKVTGGDSVWNQGTVDASGSKGGTVAVSTKNFQNDGTISAKGTAGVGGSVGVTYSGNALGSTSGLIDASGSTNGGAIQITGTGAASQAYLSLTLDVKGTTGAGGSIDIDSSSIYLTGATLKASGAIQGGRIFLGESDPLSGTTLPLAKTVFVGSTTSVRANAKTLGNGGQIGVNSSGVTEFLGDAEARGFGQGGNGGLIEISGQGNTFFGGTANASAPQGKAGIFKLDPKFITVAPITGSQLFEFLDPDPQPGNGFGNPDGGVINLPTNFTVITSPGDSFSASNNGAVYLFSDVDGSLVSTIRGSQANDNVGSQVYTFDNGNFAVISPFWNGNRGALTFGNGTTGFTAGGGAVSSANSLVGSSSGDYVGGNGYQVIGEGGNLLVFSPNWNGNRGAVTFIDPSGSGSITGAIGSANSLVGASSGDLIGDVSNCNSLVSSGSSESIGEDEFIQLSTGNFVLLSTNFGGGAGAVTFIPSDTAKTGVVSATTSLIGSSSSDHVGSDVCGCPNIIDLENGHYLVLSPNWNNSAGAVTLGDSNTGISGAVGATNSLIGSTTNDQVGSGSLFPLFDSNGCSIEGYLILSPNWNGSAGAITWFDGNTLPVGAVSATNSLVGGTPGDRIGSGDGYCGNNGIVLAPDGSGNYLIFSPNWTNPNEGDPLSNAGAVTYFNATSGVVGTVDETNSVVGSYSGDQVGSGGLNNVIALTTGNFLLYTPNWNGGAGAVTFMQGNPEGSPTSGFVNDSNSLVGSYCTDNVGSGGIYALSNGNYVVSSPNWNAGAGAVTVGDGYEGIADFVSTENSLTGFSGGPIISSVPDGDFSTLGVVSGGGDSIGSGGIVLLHGSSNFLVISPSWNGGAGAVTWVDGGAGRPGETVDDTNSLVGQSCFDPVGGVTDLQNGSYVVVTSGWNNGTGAVTVGSDSSGVSGFITTDNSLTGANTGDSIGSGGIVTLGGGSSGNFLVLSPNWGGGAGAVTLVSGDRAGQIVDSTTSLVGSLSSDAVGSSGSITDLLNGHYLVTTSNWNNGTGAVTFGDGVSGTSGVIDGTNSLVGAGTGDFIGNGGITVLNNNNYLVYSPSYAQGAGAVTWVNGATGQAFSETSSGATVSSNNSLVGSTSNDNVGSGGITILNNGNYLVLTPNYNLNAGAITWGDQAVGVAGQISSTNSLVGANTGDNIGSGGITFLNNGNFLISSPSWGFGAGAITWEDQAVGVVGQVDATTSLVGSSGSDNVGSGGITILNNGNYLVLSPNWSTSAGAVTWGDQAVGVKGAIDSTNSLVGSTTDDQVGGGGIKILNNGNYLVVSSQWNNGTGAVTWADQAVGVKGTIDSTNSLIGATSGDQIGSGMLINLSGDDYLIQSPNFNGNAGAVTYFNDAAGVTGVVDSTVNSLVGANPGDGVGSGCNDIFKLSTGNYLLLTPTWGSGAGAVTFFAGGSAPIGIVDSDSSLVGSTTNDNVGTTIHQLTNGNYLVQSPNWNNQTGAVTWGDGNAGVTGVVSSDNSLVGVNPGDQVGSGCTIDLSNGAYLVQSPYFASSAGAATWGDGTVGITGQVSLFNSLIGGAPDAGEQFAGVSNDQSIYLVSFTSDTSLGGDGRVLAGGINGPTVSLTDPNTLTYSNNPSGSVTITADEITAVTNTGTNVVLQANTDITINQDIITDCSSLCSSGSGATTGGSIELDAGRSIYINANITTANGDLTLLANDHNAISSYRDAGPGSIVQSTGTLNVGTGTFTAVVSGTSTLTPGFTPSFVSDAIVSTPNPSIAGSILLNNVIADTAIINAIDPTSDVALTGQIQANFTNLAAGRGFINAAGPNAITGTWTIYSQSPSFDSFGGLVSNNFATFGATPPPPPIGGSVVLSAVADFEAPEGNSYLFGVVPQLTVVALNRQKATGGVIDYSSPQNGVDYAVLGFVNAAAYGNVFTQDTAENTLTGSPILSSDGAGAGALPGNYTINILQDTLQIERTDSGYILPPGNFVNGTLTVGNFFADNPGDKDDQTVAAFETTGFEKDHRLPFPLFTVLDPKLLDLIPIGVSSETGGAINDGDGTYITLGSSTSDAAGPDRLVTPGNGIWNIYYGSVRQGPPPEAVLLELKKNLSPAVFSHLHQLLYGTP